MRHSFSLVPFLLASLLSAQGPCKAEFDSLTFVDNVSMGGPNLLLAIRTDVTVPLAVFRIEMFTGEGAGTNSIGVWSHDAANNRPLANLGTTSWSMTRPNGWQGGNFATPLVLLPGTYWVVWGPQNGSQSSVEASGSGLPGAQFYRGSFDGGSSWNGPFQSYQWKFRLFCGANPGSAALYGTGCSGAARRVVHIGANGVPTLGLSFDLLLASAAFNAPTLLFVGGSDQLWGSIPLPLDLSFLGMSGCRVLAEGAVILPINADGAGRARVTVGVPNTTALLGNPLFAQWFVTESGANPLNLIHTTGIKTVVGN